LEDLRHHSILSAVNGTAHPTSLGNLWATAARTLKVKRRGLGGHGGDLGKMRFDAVPDCPQPSIVYRSPELPCEAVGPRCEPDYAGDR